MSKDATPSQTTTFMGKSLMGPVALIVVFALLGTVLMAGNHSDYADHPGIGGAGLGIAMAGCILLMAELVRRWRSLREDPADHEGRPVLVASILFLLVGGMGTTIYGLSCMCDDPSQPDVSQGVITFPEAQGRAGG